MNKNLIKLLLVIERSLGGMGNIIKGENIAMVKDIYGHAFTLTKDRGPIDKSDEEIHRCKLLRSQLTPEVLSIGISLMKDYYDEDLSELISNMQLEKELLSIFDMNLNGIVAFDEEGNTPLYTTSRITLNILDEKNIIVILNS